MAVLVVVPFLVGCTTLEQQRRQSMREQSEMQRLQLEVDRLQARVEALEVAKDDTYSHMENLRQDAAAERSEMTGRIAETERVLKVLDAARETDRQLVIDSLTKKISGLMQSHAVPPSRAMAGYEHVVQKGETLSEVATAYKVTVNAIIKANNLKNPDAIRVGQTLFIPE